MNKKNWIVLLVSLLFCAESFSEPVVDQSFLNDYVGKQWTTEDGLPGMTIVAMLQDQKGYMYLGTYDGLVRFDGVEFKVFSRAVDEKYDFATAHALYEDSAGNIWIGHNDEGVTCMGKDGSIKKFTTDNGLPHNKINALYEDLDNNIWVGTVLGSCYITPEEKVVIPPCAEDVDEKAIVNEIFCDSSGRVWISNGLNLYVYENHLVRKFGGFETFDSDDVNSVSQDNTGALWFSVAPHYAIRVKSGQETVFDIKHDQRKGSVVHGVIQDSLGHYWIATDSGVTIIHDGIYTYLDTSNGLPEDGVNQVIEDDEGNIWMALNRGGLYRLSKGKFQTVNTGVSINSICEDEERGLVWIGSDAGVLCYKDNHFIENELTEFTKGVRVRDIHKTYDNEILVSEFSYDIPFVVYYPDNTIKSWSVDDGISGNRCRVSIKLKNQDYYVGTAHALTVIRKDGSTEVISKKLEMENSYIMWLYEDKDNQVWVGTNGAGIYILKDEQIVKQYNRESGLAGDVVFKIKEMDGCYWIGTGTGLSRLDPETDSFTSFNSTNGLGTDSVFQMFKDYTDTVWMLSNKGIISTKYSEINDVVNGFKKRITVHTYGKSDGLNTGGITSTSCSLQDSKGRLWFTLVDGFAIYDPIKSEKNKRPPKIEIEEYVIDNEHYSYYGGKIIVPPSGQRLSIKYTGLTSISPERVLFKYKLDGFENEYSNWESARTISYTNMKPGTYTFTLIALNNDGVQSKPSEPITIVKQAHIWQHLWFWLAIGFFLLILVTLYVVHKIRSMHRTQIQLEKKVDERTQELKIANEKSEALLLNILPAEVAKELTENPGRVIAEKFPNVSVLFTDIVGFTKMSSGLSAEAVVTILNQLISKFDDRAKACGIEKIKTIGDAYMAACGLTKENNPEDAHKMVSFAQGLLQDVMEFNKNSLVKINIRVGINTGDLVAGVIGKSKFIYDVWGDTVNVASRMESTGEAMKIHVTEETYRQTKDYFKYSEGVEFEVKGKGLMKSYFITQ